MASAEIDPLKKEISGCEQCIDSLPLGPRPIVQIHASARIAIIGQAPGSKVHDTGIAWDDPSGERLRQWLSVSSDQFYSKLFALVPMGFCYPGRGKSGDLPPRPECAPKWHQRVFEHLDQVKLTLLIGRYAQNYYLEQPGRSLTELVRNFQEFQPKYFPLPHPSPRNNIWMKKNAWFEREVLPTLRSEVARCLKE